MEKFNKSDILFTIDGVQVQYERKVDNGYLARKCSNIYDEDGNVIDYIISKDITFHEMIFKNPPRDKLNKKIEELKLTIENNRRVQKLEIDYHESKLLSIKNEIEDVKRAYPQILKHEVLNQLVMYLNNDFKYIIYIKNMELSKRENSWTTSNFYIDTINGNLHYIYLKPGDNESHDWQYDKPIKIFKDEESAVEFIKLQFMNQLQAISQRKFTHWSGKSSERIKSMKELMSYSHFNSYSYIQADEKLMKMYNDKMLEYEKMAEKEKQDAIDKELAELKKKQDELLKKK